MSFITFFMLFQVATAGIEPMHLGGVAPPDYSPTVLTDVGKSLDLLEEVAQTPTEGFGLEVQLAAFIEQGAKPRNALELAMISQMYGCEETCLVTALHGATVLSEAGTLPSAAVAIIGSSMATVAGTFIDGDPISNAILLETELKQRLDNAAE